MTTIVGILSKGGIAFAADSAATVTSPSGQKITHHANKIFALSRYQPVGVALYNNLSFMQIPWDAIFKSYRSNLDRKSYGTLAEYISSFWDYMRKSILPNLTKDQDDFLTASVKKLYDQLRRQTLEKLGVKDSASLNQKSYLEEMLCQMQLFCQDNNTIAEDYKGFNISDLEKHAKLLIDRVLEQDLKSLNCPKGYRKTFSEALLALIRYEAFGYYSDIYSGLVFFGYGTKEFLPSCFEYKVNIALCGRIKFYPQYTKTIRTVDASVIVPFAQTDVTNTVIRAVEEKLKNKFYEENMASITVFRDEIVQQLTDSGAPQKLIDVLKGLDTDKYAKEFKDGMDKYIQDEYIEPLVQTVAFLSKEDLAEMAESLVKMTCLKRRITKTEETVGGPVDVAVVTKGDGFIWIKRKHYFSPEINRDYFDRHK